MDSFIITDPRTGRRLKVEGTVEPTRDQIRDMFARADSPVEDAPPQAQSDREGADALGKFAVSPETVPEARPGVGTAVREMGTSIGGAMIGQTVGAVGGPVGMAIGGAVGSGLSNITNQLMRMREDPNYRFKFGELAAEVGTGAIPGGPLMKAGVKTVAREAGKQALGGVASGNVQTMIDEGRLQTTKENVLSGAVPAVGGAAAQKLLSGTPEAISAARKAMRKAPQEVKTLQAGQKLGLKALPSELDPSTITTQAESLGGAVASKRRVQLDNQGVVNNAVKKQLGIKTGEISPSALKKIRGEEGEVYEQFAAISSKAEPELATLNRQREAIPYFSNDPGNAQRQALIDQFDATNASRRAELETAVRANPTELRRVRGEAQKLMDSYYASGGKNVDAQLKSFELREQANQIEGAMEQAARQSGNPDLADNLIKARRRIAMTYSAEDALNPGNFNIDPDELAKQFARGVPLSGEMRTIAEFKNAFRESLREASKVPDPDVSYTSTVLAGLAGAGTLYGTQDPVLAAASAAALPLARKGARTFTASEGAQRRATEAMIEREVGKKVKVPTEVRAGEAMLRATGQEVGRRVSDETPEIVRADVEALQADPQGFRAEFEEKYGKGSAAKYLFRKTPSNTD